MSALRKLLPLFSRRDKFEAAGLIVLILGGSLLEMLGVGLVFPFVTLIQDPTAVTSSRYLNLIYVRLGQPPYMTFIVYLAVGLVLVYLIKNGYLAILAFLQHGFIQKKRVDFAHKLFDAYLNKPYTFHIETNSADLVRNLTIEISRVVNNVMMVSIKLITDGTVAVGLIALLFVADITSAFAALILVSLTGIIFYVVVRRKLAEYGRIRLDQQGILIRQINHGIGGIKEVKVLGTEDYFLALFDSHSRAFSSAYRYYETLGDLPRLFLESVAVSALAAMVILFQARSDSFQTVLPTLSLFTVAAFRLMPTINRLQSSVNSMRFFSDSVSVITEHLELDGDAKAVSAPERRREAKPTMTVPKLSKQISLIHLSYQYPSAAIPSLTDITLQIPCGSAVGLAGRSGAGKTTMVDVLLGLLHPTSGTVLVDGVDVEENLPGWQRQIGYIPQSIYLIDDTLRRNIALGIPDARIDDERVWGACKAARIDEFVEGLEGGLEAVVGERGVRLSGGQLQRIGIARALYRDPQVLVMDEATASLDSRTELEIVKTLESVKGRRTLIIIAHRFSTLELCDLIFVLKDGLLVESGTLADLQQEGTEFTRSIAALSQ